MLTAPSFPSAILNNADFEISTSSSSLIFRSRTSARSFSDIPSAMIRLLYVQLTAPDRITASACVNDFVLAVLATDWRVNSAASSHRHCRLSESDRVRDYN